MKKSLIGLMVIGFVVGVATSGFSATTLTAEQLKQIQKTRLEQATKAAKVVQDVNKLKQQQAEDAKKVADAMKNYKATTTTIKVTTTTTTTTTSTTTSSTTTTLGPDSLITDKFVDQNLLFIVRSDIQQITGKTFQQCLNVTLADAQLITTLESKSFQPINDLAGIEYLTNLETLNFNSGGTISSLTPLANLIKLKELNMANCGLTNLSGLENLTELTTLNVFMNTQLADLNPIAGLVNLQVLGLHNTSVENLGIFVNFVNLKSLTLSGTKVKDISALIANIGLGAGASVNLPSFAPVITDRIPWSQVQQLMAKGVNVIPANQGGYNSNL